MLKLVVAEGAAVDMPRIAENITVLSGEWTVTGLWRRYCQYVRLKDKAKYVVLRALLQQSLFGGGGVKAL